MLWLQEHVGSVHFDAWRGEVVRFEPNVAGPRLMWLWTSLLREPELKPRIAVELEPVTVLPRGALFLVRLNGTIAREIQVELYDPLRMQPGTGGRFESRAVASQLRISKRQLQSHPLPGAELIRNDIDLLDMEAATLRVSVDRLELKDGGLALSVDSLNEAYMRASLRLEPELRSHGGSIYENVYWKHDGQSKVLWQNYTWRRTIAEVDGGEEGGARLTPLDWIRQQVELGVWELPSSARTVEPEAETGATC